MGWVGLGWLGGFGVGSDWLLGWLGVVLRNAGGANNLEVLFR